MCGRSNNSRVHTTTGIFSLQTSGSRTHGQNLFRCKLRTCYVYRTSMRHHPHMVKSHGSPDNATICWVMHNQSFGRKTSWNTEMSPTSHLPQHIDQNGPWIVCLSPEVDESSHRKYAWNVFFIRMDTLRGVIFQFPSDWFVVHSCPNHVKIPHSLVKPDMNKKELVNVFPINIGRAS